MISTRLGVTRRQSTSSGSHPTESFAKTCFVSQEHTGIDPKRILPRMTALVSAPPRMSKPERPAPLDVYYVVETMAGVLGERHHLVSSSLYATAAQAEMELQRLTALNAATEYAVWKSSTYVEPARWAYDVVLADGTVIRQDASMLPGRG